MTGRHSPPQSSDALVLDAVGVVAIVRELVPSVLPAYLPGQRWFGEKDRAVTAASVSDAAMIQLGADWVALLIVRLNLDGAEEADYFVPLALVTEAPAATPVLAGVETARGRRVLVDALMTTPFRRWCLHQLRSGQAVAGERGRFLWEPLPGFDERFAAASATAPELVSAEQSNSSIRYDDAIFLKVFRRLRAGTNPDEEIGRYLATRTAFRRLPLPLAAARYVDQAGDAYPIALGQSFEPNLGDGWSFALRLLSSSPAELLRPLAGLGARTAQLHLALGQETGDPAFCPEVVSAEDANRWESALRSRITATVSALQRRGPELDPSLVDGIALLRDRVPELERRAAGFRAAVGSRAIRVHGDYHLGQVLRTPDGDWTILDFEGEPARPIAERRAKSSPLKDVAGMLRSLGYARSAALRAGGDGAADAAALQAWDTAARGAYLAGYRETLAVDRLGLVPGDEAGFRAALEAWELDKAVYELRYELSNRPDWIGHALGTLLGDPPPANAGG